MIYSVRFVGHTAYDDLTSSRYICVVLIFNESETWTCKEPVVVSSGQLWSVVINFGLF